MTTPFHTCGHMMNGCMDVWMDGWVGGCCVKQQLRHPWERANPNRTPYTVRPAGTCKKRRNEKRNRTERSFRRMGGHPSILLLLFFPPCSEADLSDVAAAPHLRPDRRQKKLGEGVFLR